MPYTVGIQDQSGQLLGKGIAGAGDAIMAGLQQWKEKSDKAKSLRTALSVYMPDQKDKFQTMGLDELEGQVQGLQMQNQARQQQSQQTEQAAKMDLLRSQMVEQNQRVSDQQAQALSLQRMRELNGGAMPADMQGPPRAPVDDMGTALRNAIAAGVAPRDLSELATASAHLQSVSPDAGPLSFEEDPVSGERFARKKNTVLPSGVNPLKSFGQTTGLIDENGNPIGAYAVRTPKGLQVVRPPVDRSASDMKANIGSLFEGEKALTEIDRQIQGSEARNAGIAGKVKVYEGMTAVPKEQIDELKARRARAKGHLDVLDGMINSGKAGAVTQMGAGAAAAGVGVGAGARDGEAVRAAYKAGKISKEQALQQLKGLGYGD